MKTKIAILTLLCLSACKDGEKVDPKTLCQYSTEICTMADLICGTDNTVQTHPACVKRDQACGPVRTICAHVNPVPTPTPS